MNIFEAKLYSCIIATAAILTVVAAILYFMNLPIFSQVELAWTFVAGLGTAALAALLLAYRGIWSADR